MWTNMGGYMRMYEDEALLVRKGVGGNLSAQSLAAPNGYSVQHWSTRAASPVRPKG